MKRICLNCKKEFTASGKVDNCFSCLSSEKIIMFAVGPRKAPRHFMGFRSSLIDSHTLDALKYAAYKAEKE